MDDSKIREWRELLARNWLVAVGPRRDARYSELTIPGMGHILEFMGDVSGMPADRLCGIITGWEEQSVTARWIILKNPVWNLVEELKDDPYPEWWADERKRRVKIEREQKRSRKNGPAPRPTSRIHLSKGCNSQSNRRFGMAGKRGYVEVGNGKKLWSLMECSGGAWLIADIRRGGNWDAWTEESHSKIVALPLGFYRVTATYNPPHGYTLKSVKATDPFDEIKRLSAIVDEGTRLYTTTSPGIQFGMSSQHMIRGAQTAKRDQTKGLLHALMERYRA
jgi:hypothetical protein